MQSMKILVVDDEPKIRRIITSYLAEEGFDVAEAADGETALALATAEPDLVILDVGLPGIDRCAQLIECERFDFGVAPERKY